MLKFLYDEKKKQNFLEFWKLKDLEDFKTRRKDIVFYASQYARLDVADKRFIAQLLKESFQDKPPTKTPSPSPLTPSHSPSIHKIETLFSDSSNSKKLNEALLERLHDLHFINWLKNRSSLMETQDTVELTDEFKAFLDTILIIEQSEDIAQFFIKHFPKNPQNLAKKFSTSEWKLLYKFSLLYAVPFFFIIKNQTLVELIKKGFTHKLLTFSILKETGEMFIAVNFAFNNQLQTPSTQKSKLPTITVQQLSLDTLPFKPTPVSLEHNYLVKKKLTEKLFALIAILYEKKTKETAILKQIPIRNENEREYLNHVAQNLLSSRQWKAFLRKSVYVKIRRILQITAPKSFILLKELTPLIETAFSKIPHKQEDATTPETPHTLAIAEHLLLVALNQQRFWKRQSHLTLAQFKNIIKPLSAWTLIQYQKAAKSTQETLTLNLQLIRHVLQTNTKKGFSTLQASDSLIIDSDMTLTVFNETISLPAIHFLSLFTKISFADHTTQFTPKLELSHLSWFAGLDETQTLRTLEKLSPEYFTRQVKEFFQLYFEHITLAKAYKVILLKTSSHQIFLKMKYALEKEPKLKKHILFLEKEAALLFHKRQTYLKAKTLLSELTSIF